jgi:nucleolar protein 56
MAATRRDSEEARDDIHQRLTQSFLTGPQNRTAVQLITTWFGAFLMEDGKVISHKLFPKDPGAIADRLERMDEWETLSEERAVAEGVDTFLVFEPRLEKVGGTLVDGEASVLDPDDYDYPRSLLHEAMLELGRRRMRAAPGPRDHLIQAVDAYDDVARALNLLRGRLRRWYGLHAPELERLVRPSEYARLIAQSPQRDSIPGIDLSESVGGSLDPEDASELADLASLVEELESRTAGLESYVTQRAKTLSPNLSYVVGPLIAARFLALAGDSKRLAMMPAGTVQTLGAEKALFRHLKSGNRPPKHGVLFQHPWVHTAPRWQRGKIARVLAAKAVIAARADWAGDRFIGEELREAVLKAVENIRRKYPAPPKGGARSQRRRTRKVRT